MLNLSKRILNGWRGNPQTLDGILYRYRIVEPMLQNAEDNKLRNRREHGSIKYNFPTLNMF